MNAVGELDFSVERKNQRRIDLDLYDNGKLVCWLHHNRYCTEDRICFGCKLEMDPWLTFRSSRWPDVGFGRPGFDGRFCLPLVAPQPKMLYWDD